MTRASFTAPGANRSTLFRDGKGKQKSRNFQRNSGKSFKKGEKFLNSHPATLLYIAREHKKKPRCIAAPGRRLRPQADGRLLSYRPTSGLAYMFSAARRMRFDRSISAPRICSASSSLKPPCPPLPSMPSILW